MAKKKGWENVVFTPFEESVTAQKKAFGDGAPESKAVLVRMLSEVGQTTKSRYVVIWTVHELTSYRYVSFPFPTKAGRSTVSVMVFDSESTKYVWDSRQTATSRHTEWFGTDSLRSLQDQAMFNALQKCLEPFVKGERKDIQTASVKLLAKCVGLASDTQIMLDIGNSSGARVGDQLISIDSTVRIEITELLANGSIAKVVTGKPVDGMVFRTP